MVDLLPRTSWPSANLQHRYHVSRIVSIDPSNHAWMLDCFARGICVVVNLYLFRNQVDFFENHELLVSGRSMHKKAPVKHYKNQEAMLA
jgi:hypothetical protein